MDLHQRSKFKRKIAGLTSLARSLLILPVIVVIALGPTAHAQITQCDINDLIGENPYFDSCSSGGQGVCSATSSGAPTSGSSNLDYAGRPILNQVELQDFSQNETTYQQAAQQVGIPWQVLAALHYREHSLKLDEPDMTGIYQIVNPADRTSGAYPPAGVTLTPSQFLQQTLDAANFIKKDGAGLGSQPSTDTIKNAFGLYNGLPPLYGQQATYLGFNSSTQAYEGSPYVMNMADTQRDPNIPRVVSSGRWDQYVTPITVAPADTSQYGAFVVYASLSGITLSGSNCSIGSIDCSNSTAGTAQIRQQVVCIAQEELSLWRNGTYKPSTNAYLKYTSSNTNEPWCADFVSWVYNQAGHPFGPAGSNTNDWDVSYVGNLLVPPQDSGKFTAHPAAGYTPQPGDVALHYDPSQNPPWVHTNIVVSVGNGQINLIGGDQVSGGGGGPYQTNVVSVETITQPTDNQITYYISPN